ncbi:hypothetical protein TNCV_4444271 [Trichonephila clavipes]|nr:hypothetical protein TNCV_4444271 [Trichonephila clavipes]
MWAANDLNEEECRSVVIKTNPQCRCTRAICSLPDVFFFLEGSQLRSLRLRVQPHLKQQGRRTSQTLERWECRRRWSNGWNELTLNWNFSTAKGYEHHQVTNEYTVMFI